ncbi:uncharacterized protein BDZ99DRAFT_525831 [Mytilinidion resinicola]|uniref:Uncharacterized protein n=1 Tax=Mytilinidion resinicola TaxID=574789 RepID=A0A6A6Y6K7_9PEZI|nr:uncharacterized protein BDZ99DRAFT_525831 [Mytilinidion resinicola]KAF2804239.1 hypothetical protein BDZ99DRAFT_525831 [Mytilinidion resinicola]
MAESLVLTTHVRRPIHELQGPENKIQAALSFSQKPLDAVQAISSFPNTQTYLKQLPALPVRAKVETIAEDEAADARYSVESYSPLHHIHSLKRSPTLPIRPIRFRSAVEDSGDAQDDQDGDDDAQNDEGESTNVEDDKDEEEEEDPDRVFFDAQVRNPQNWKEGFEYHLGPIDESDVAMLYFHSSKDCDCQLPDALGNPRSKWKTQLDNEYVFQDRSDDEYEEEEGSQRDWTNEEMVGWQTTTTCTVEDLAIA